MKMIDSNAVMGGALDLLNFGTQKKGLGVQADPRREFSALVRCKCYCVHRRLSICSPINAKRHV